MSRLQQIQAKKKKYNIKLEEGAEPFEIEIIPFGIDDLDLFESDPNASMDEQIKTFKKIVSKVLKTAIPDCTDEEIKGLSLGIIKQIVEFAKDACGLTQQKSGTNAIKARIAAIAKAKADKEAKAKGADVKQEAGQTPSA